MAKRASKPSWVLLSPNKLPPASEIKNILGAIVPDFENPAQNAIPPNTSVLIPEDWFAEPTVDGNFKVALECAKGLAANARLGNILNAVFEKSVSNDLHLSSTLVKTYALKRENMVFQLLKQSYKAELLELINQAPDHCKNSIFEIVALKTCLDAGLMAKDVMDRSIQAKVTVPVSAAVMASTGVPLPTNIDPEAATASTARRTIDESHVAKGERIFAVQCRIIKKHSEWQMFSKEKKPEEPKLKDLYYPTGPSMYGDEDSDQELDEDENDDDDDDEDPIELGDMDHSRDLAVSTNGDVVITTF